MAKRWANSKSRDESRSERQYPLRSWFAFMAVVSVLLAFFSAKLRQERASAVAESRIKELGGWVGRNGEVTSVGLDHTSVSDEDLRLIAKVSNLIFLDLSNTEVSDAGIAHLQGLRYLQMLVVDGTHVTPEGMKRLKRSNPLLFPELKP